MLQLASGEADCQTVQGYLQTFEVLLKSQEETREAQQESGEVFGGSSLETQTYDGTEARPYNNGTELLEEVDDSSDFEDLPQPNGVTDPPLPPDVVVPNSEEAGKKDEGPNVWVGLAVVGAAVGGLAIALNNQGNEGKAKKRERREDE